MSKRGRSTTGRAAALSAGRADATLLTPPAYFRLEEAGFKNLGNLADHDDIFAATTYLMKKTTIAGNPRLPEQIVSRPPVLLVHGDQDPVVPFESLSQAADALAAAGVETVTHVSRGMAHGIAPDGLGLALEFIRDRLAPVARDAL